MNEVKLHSEARRRSRVQNIPYKSKNVNFPTGPFFIIKWIPRKNEVFSLGPYLFFNHSHLNHKMMAHLEIIFLDGLVDIDETMHG